MKVDKGIKRRTIAYFSITTLLLVFIAISYSVSLPQTLGHYHWRNAPGNVSIGEMTTYNSEYSIRPEDDAHAITMARDENGEAIVKGMPLKVFVYGIGEGFEFPEHWGFKAGEAMVITSYCMTLLLIICFICILVNIIRGFSKEIYFSKMQVVLLRWSAFFSFVLYLANELADKFNMLAIGQLYGKTSDIRLATSFQMEIQEIIIPMLLLIFAEIISISLHLNEEEAMTI